MIKKESNKIHHHTGSPGRAHHEHHPHHTHHEHHQSHPQGSPIENEIILDLIE